MERRDLLYYPQQGTTVSSQVSLYSYLSAHHLALLKIQIPYLAYDLDDSVTFLSSESDSPDIFPLYPMYRHCQWVTLVFPKNFSKASTTSS